MIFKGMKFSRCRAVVVLPGSQWEGAGDPGNFMTFGKLISLKNTLAGRIPKGAVKVADTIWRDYDAGVWAIPIKCNGHSLTNMMFAENSTRLYLFQNGRVWTSKFRVEKPLTKRNESILMDLSDGQLTVTWNRTEFFKDHKEFCAIAEENEVYQRKLYTGEWKELMEFVKRNKTQYTGRKNAQQK